MKQFLMKERNLRITKTQENLLSICVLFFGIGWLLYLLKFLYFELQILFFGITLSSFLFLLYYLKSVISGIFYIKSNGLPEKTEIAIWLAELMGILFLLPGIIGMVEILLGIFSGDLWAFDYYNFIRSIFAILLIISSHLLKKKKKWAWNISITLFFVSLVIFLPVILIFFENNFRLVISEQPFRLSQLIIFYLLGLALPLTLLFLDRKKQVIFVAEGGEAMFEKKETDKEKASFLKNLKILIILIFIFISSLYISFPDFFAQRCSTDNDCPPVPNVENWECRGYCDEGRCGWECKQGG